MKRERCSKTNTYIIDEEYRLQYVSEGLSEKFPELRLGGVCYQEFRGHGSAMQELSAGAQKKKDRYVLQ